MEEDRIKGFLTGADDYIVKPFSMQELLLRMDVFIRRTRKLHADEVQKYAIGELRFSYTDLKLYAQSETHTLHKKKPTCSNSYASMPTAFSNAKKYCSMCGAKTITSWAAAWTCS